MARKTQIALATRIESEQCLYFGRKGFSRELRATHAALEALQAERATIQTRLEEMRAEKLQQQPTTDPDARCQQWVRVGYNVQTAVDSHHQLIVHHEVIQSRNDENALYPMAHAARQVLEQDELTVVANVRSAPMHRQPTTLGIATFS